MRVGSSLWGLGPMGIILVHVDPTAFLGASLCFRPPRVSPGALEWSWLFLPFLNHVWGTLIC